MKKINIKNQIDEIFKIVGEDCNISNNLTYREYLNLGLEEKKLVEEIINERINERRGIFKTDFQIAFDKLNKIIKKEYGKEKIVTNINELNNFINYHAINSIKKNGLRGILKKIFKRTTKNKEETEIDDVLMTDGDNELLFPEEERVEKVPPVAVFRKNSHEKTNVVKETNDELLFPEEEKVEKVPPVAVFRKKPHEKTNVDKETNDEVLLPEEISDNKETSSEQVDENSISNKDKNIEEVIIPDAIDNEAYVNLDSNDVLGEKQNEKTNHEVLPNGTFDNEEINENELVDNNDDKVNFEIKKDNQKELEGLKKERQKYELLSCYNHLTERRKKLVARLNRLTLNEKNKNLICDIEIAIDKIDNYLECIKQAGMGLISKEKLKDVELTTYTVVEYVMDEKLKRK